MPKFDLTVTGTESKSAFILLVDSVFGSEAAKARELFWEWSMEVNPANEVLDPKVVMLHENTNLIGSVVLVSAKMKLDDDLIGCHWVCSIMTLPNHRGKGLHLIKSLYTEGAARLGFPFGSLVAMYQRRGAAIILETEQRFYLWKAGDWLKAKHPRLKLLAPIINFVGKIVPTITTLINTSSSTLNIQPVNKFGADFDQLWNEASSGYRGITVRDSDYLNWRYVECPIHEYQSFGAYRKNRLVGFIVIRTGIKKNIKEGYIIDFFVEYGDNSTLEALIRHATIKLKQNQTVLIKVMMSVHMRWVQDAFRKAGFWLHKPHLKLVAFSKDQQLMQGVFQNNEGWLVAFGDSDNDL